MGVQRLLQGVAGGREERRRSPRVRCRLHCSLRQGRRWLRARVLDVSEHGLCLLSPVELQVRQPVVLRIDVPDHGPVEVEATAWHARRVKAGASRKKAWSVGMLISTAGEGFERLLPDAGGAREPLPPDAGGAREPLPPDAGGAREPLPPDAGGAREPLPPPAADALRSLDERRRETAGEPPPEVLLEPEPLGLPGSAEPREDDAEDLELELEADGDSVSRSLHVFRVRVKAVGGPRTRALTLGAASAEEAEALARSELEGDWAVLDVRRA